MLVVLGVLTEIGALRVEPPAGIVIWIEARVPRDVHRESFIGELGDVSDDVGVQVAVHCHREGLPQAHVAELGVIRARFEAEEDRYALVRDVGRVESDVGSIPFDNEDVVGRDGSVVSVDLTGD